MIAARRGRRRTRRMDDAEHERLHRTEEANAQNAVNVSTGQRKTKAAEALKRRSLEIGTTPCLLEEVAASTPAERINAILARRGGATGGTPPLSQNGYG